MKKLLFLLLFIIPFYTHAQITSTYNKTDSVQYQPKVEFCVVQPERSGSIFYAYIDQGHKWRAWHNNKKDLLLRDEQGKGVKFETLVDVFYFMEEQGWTMVTSYSTTFVSKGSDSNVYFVYKRPYQPHAQMEQK